MQRLLLCLSLTLSGQHFLGAPREPGVLRCGQQFSVHCQLCPPEQNGTSVCSLGAPRAATQAVEQFQVWQVGEEELWRLSDTGSQLQWLLHQEVGLLLHPASWVGRSRCSWIYNAHEEEATQVSCESFR